MKIMVVLTGGTIGSSATKNNINVNINTMPEIVERYCEQYENDVDFTVVSAMSVLSENITYNEWNVLLQTLASVDFGKFDGIIVTHGTDTLPYSAALLGFVFGNCEKPIVLVSSNNPLNVEASNGLRNFASAVTLIKQKLNGVFATAGYDETDFVFSATSLMESDGYNDRFSDFSAQQYGIVENGLFIKNDDFNHIGERKLVLPENIRLENEIVFIQPYPNLNYDMINLEHKPKAILHSLYHSGTACVAGKNKSLVNFIKKCTALGIDFYVAPFKSGDVQYITANAIVGAGAGAVALCNISPIAAYVKLCLLYNAKNLVPKLDMLKPIYNEFFK